MPSIAIYNPISGHGHLDSWNAIFIQILLEDGWSVLSISPNPNTLIDALNCAGCPNIHRLEAINFYNYSKSGQSGHRVNFRRLIHVLRKLSLGWHKVVFGTLEQDPEVGLQIPRWCIFSFYLPIHFIRNYLLPNFRSRFPRKNVKKISASDEMLAIDELARSHKFEPEIVFNMFLDSMSFDRNLACKNPSDIKLKWAGIRFSPEEDDFLKFKKLNNFFGVAYLDEKVFNKHRELLPNVVSTYLPDISNNDLPGNPSGITLSIKEKSKGRKIIFMGGIIGARKNLRLWLQLIGMADSRDWYFVQVGEFDFHNLGVQDFLSVYGNLISPPENFMLIPEYISDERLFNEILSVSDIVFAVYSGFKNSSNMITKASFFHKPILVSDRYLMGERVERFKVGAVVPEDSAKAAMDALYRLVSNPCLASNFDAYNITFNLDALRLNFVKFINQLKLI